MMIHPTKILIMGDSGRGKSTLAKKLSDRLNISRYDLDDFLWKKKYSIRNEKEVSISLIKDVYAQNQWIVEGATTYLVAEGLEKADIIIHLGFSSIFSQWKSIVKRAIKEKRNIFGLPKFLIFVARKRYGIGYKSNRTKRKEALGPHSQKVVYLRSYRAIDQFVKNFKQGA